MNFIVCDDKEQIISKVIKVIDSIMMKNKLHYKVHSFNDYGVNFRRIMERELSNKIYILDIEMPSASGIDIAREIRETDIDSIIIFLTSHSELGNDLLNDELMFLTFIPKLNNMDARLESAINKAIKMSGIKQAIRFQDCGVVYTVPLDDILYITTDQIDRKTLIVTPYNEFRLGKTLHEVSLMLNGNFEQTHRACIVNTKRVVAIDKRNNEIIFDNNAKINLLSDTYKKALKKNG